MSTTAPALSDLFDHDHLLEARPTSADLRRALQLVAGLPPTAESTTRIAVLTNVVGVIARGGAEDFQVTAALSARFGHQEVAQVQNELDGCLDTGILVPFATAAIVSLSRTTQIADALLRAGRPAEVAHTVARGCAHVAFWLLLTGIDKRHVAPAPTTSDDIVWTVTRGSADGWRRILANIAANPWGPAGADLADLARAADLETAARAIEQCSKVYREQAAASERVKVAREIRRLIAVSGCTQREFARHIGTSAPRLSTYGAGGGTPSAAMMLRIGNASAALAARPHTSRDQ